VLQNFCDQSKGSISRFIWSHRAQIAAGRIDGSRIVVQELLEAGIRNFDVDISCVALQAPSTHCNFIIAHPSVIRSVQNITHLPMEQLPQSVSAFLDQVHQFHTESNELERGPPHITMEMKFHNPQHQLGIIRELHQHPMASRIALVLTNPAAVETLLQNTSCLGAALAYRNRPSNESDFVWPASVAESDYLASPVSLLGPCIPQTQMGKATTRLEVHMPDIRLITTTTEKIHCRRPCLVVPWVVDSEDVLIKALDNGVDGVISNEPLKMLRFLDSLYRIKCRTWF